MATSLKLPSDPSILVTSESVRVLMDSSAYFTAYYLDVVKRKGVPALCARVINIPTLGKTLSPGITSEVLLRLYEPVDVQTGDIKADLNREDSIVGTTGLLERIFSPYRIVLDMSLGALTLKPDSRAKKKCRILVEHDLIDAAIDMAVFSSWDPRLDILKRAHKTALESEEPSAWNNIPVDFWDVIPENSSMVTRFPSVELSKN